MSRRDTIIVAVLINMTLLAALFLMASRNEWSAYAEPLAFTYQSPEPQNSKIVFESVVESSYNESSDARRQEKVLEQPPRDEVDRVIENYSLQTKTAQPESLLQQINERVPAEKPQINKNEAFVEVTVKRGDYLEKIAKVNQTTVGAIMRLNALSSPKIEVGQILRIPVQSAPVKQASLAQKQGESEPEYYTIKSGIIRGK